MLSAVDGTEEFKIGLGPDDPVRVLWPALTTGEHAAELTCEGGRCYAARFDAAPPDGSETAVALVWRHVE